MALVMAPEAGLPPSHSNLALFSVLSCHPPLLSPLLLPPVAWFPLLGGPYPSPSRYGFYFCGFNKNFTRYSGLGWWGQRSWGRGLWLLPIPHQTLLGQMGVGHSSPATWVSREWGAAPLLGPLRSGECLVGRRVTR